ncbi:MAG: sugar phosphate isomerase/epimerase [Verrucomicrobia bacterium]|nr:sugar phosphate isomerase/epimerase [Verrucomicrobiota bacterium]
MQTNQSLSRREFVSNAAVAAAALALPGSTHLVAQGQAQRRFNIIGFSKPFQNLSPDDTADLVAEVGWNGIECPVRAKGQIEPERVEEGLPKMVEALKKRNLEVSIVTTDIRNTSQPLTEKVLRTAAKLGLKRYRLSFWRYDAGQPIPEQLNRIRSELRDLVALNKELGLCAGFQNHSGADYVGAPVWDVYELIKDFDPKYIGVCFDIGHATLEGGYSWPIQARLMERHYIAVFVKDFFWQKGAKGWRASWCPLGEGMVNPAFFKSLAKSSFSGPISQHHEYPVGTGRELVKVLKKDLQVLKEWLA